MNPCTEFMMALLLFCVCVALPSSTTADGHLALPPPPAGLPVFAYGAYSDPPYGCLFEPGCEANYIYALLLLLAAPRRRRPPSRPSGPLLRASRRAGF